ncbi:hypothetical protein [Thermococcus sp.]
MKIDLSYKEGLRKLVEEYRKNEKYRKNLDKKVDECLKWKEKIETDKLSQEKHEHLLKDIVEQLLLQGRGSKGVKTQLEKIEEIIGQWSIENLEKNLDNLGMSNKKKEKLKRILEYLKEHEVTEWIKRLDNNDMFVPRLGPKSDEDFLKEHGFFGHVPVDRHTKRFLFRTGILHWYLKKNEKNADVLKIFEEDYEVFKRAIIEFCKTFGDNIKIGKKKKLKLAENPGIFDIVIWWHCGEDNEEGCRNICGRYPRCNECVFKEHCLWYRIKCK